MALTGRKKLPPLCAHNYVPVLASTGSLHLPVDVFSRTQNELGAKFSVSEGRFSTIEQIGSYAIFDVPRWDSAELRFRNLRGAIGILLCIAGAVFALKASDAKSSGNQKATGLSVPLAPNAWSIVRSPNTSGTTHNELEGVTSNGASQCWAVGYSINATGFRQTLIERWNGTSWSIVGSPNTIATKDNELDGVACTGGSPCWAVGYGANANNFHQTLIERWNGTSWSIVGSPNTSGTTHNELRSVTCSSTSECWAVGYGTTATNFRQTLTEQYTDVLSPPSPPENLEIK